MLSRPPISLMGYHRPFAFLMSFAKLLPLAPKNCWKPCCRNHCKGQTNSKLPPFRALQGYVGAIHRPTSWSNFDPPPPSKKVLLGLWDLFPSLLCLVSILFLFSTIFCLQRGCLWQYYYSFLHIWKKALLSNLKFFADERIVLLFNLDFLVGEAKF